MSNEKKGYEIGDVVLAIFVGMALGCFVILNVLSHWDSDKAALEACMKNLPRSQYCVMLAVPSAVSYEFKTSKVGD